MSITLETAEGMSVSTKLVGVLRLVLTYDINKHHIYDVWDHGKHERHLIHGSNRLP